MKISMEKEDFNIIQDTKENKLQTQAKIVLVIMIILALLVSLAAAYLLMTLDIPESSKSRELETEERIENIEENLESEKAAEEDADSNKINVFDYPLSKGGNETVEAAECKDGYYSCMGGLKYNCKGRWFSFNEEEDKWEYEWILGAPLCNVPEKYFVSEDYQKFFKETFKAYDIKPLLIVEE